MRFGLKINKIKYVALFLGISSIIACQDDPASKYSSFMSPESGENVPFGTAMPVRIDHAKGKKIDSVAYWIDSAQVLVQKDTGLVSIKTDGLKLGNHLLTAKIFSAGQSEDLTTNFVLLSDKAPEQYGYKIINTYPHDTQAYTQGLEYHDGIFYESTGEYGTSSIRKVALKTGKVLSKTDLDSKYFGEGMTVVGSKIVMITYKERTGFEFEKKSLKLIKEFPYTTGREGWGLAYDGEKLLNSDGSNTIYFLNKDNYQKIGSIDVLDNKGKVEQLNELEPVEGKIYANVYTTNKIVIIDPKTGAVEGEINLEGLLPAGYFKTEDEIGNNVLNGIAYDKLTKRLFVTGKKWPHLFEIQLVKK